MQNGNEVVYVGCGGLLSNGCIPMSAFAVPVEADVSQKERICHICKKNEKILRANFDFHGDDLSNVVTVEDGIYADSLISSVTPENCTRLILDDVEIGKIALYEVLLQAKKSSLDFEDFEWQRYKISLKNAILTLRGTQRIFANAQPDRVVVYNALYVVNRIVCKVAELHGIPQYFLHAGANLSNRLQTLWLAKGNTFSFYRHMLENWHEMKDAPCSLEELSHVTDHFLEVTKGRSVWAYSVAPHGSDAELRSYFGIDPNHKVICATMSSYDERFAGEMVGALPADLPLLFPRQVDWIRELIKYASIRKDIFLIIRVHPREFPNKREGVLSEHAKLLQIALSDLPDNVRVNWPTDNISLYSVAGITDVFANSWSSAGKEMGLLGLPVVLYSRDLPDYPPDLNYVGTTREEYFGQLEQALADGWSSERIRGNYRWCAIEYGKVALNIGESFDRNENEKITLSKRIKNKLTRSVFPYYQQNIDCKNRSKQLSISSDIDLILRENLNSILDIESIKFPVSLQEETQALKQEIARLVNGIYGADIDYSSNSLLKKLLDFSRA